MGVALKPKEIVPSADGGVGILFANRERRGFIECGNNDEVAAIVYVRGGDKDTKAWEVENSSDGFRRALVKIKDSL